MDINDVLKLIKEGENEHIEFKERPSNLAEEIVALANADGGFILIGVTDEGDVVGTDVRKARYSVSAALNTILPRPDVRLHEVDVGGRRIVVVEVKKGDTLYTVGGRAYIRIGTMKRPLTLMEIVSRSAELALLPFDRSPTPLTVEDLWDEALRIYTEKVRRRGINIEDPLKHLRKVGMILPDGRLTFAAAALFTKNPQQTFPQLYLRVETGRRWLRMNGPIWKLVDDAMDHISSLVPVSWTISGAERVETPHIPLPAIREAIVNALVHRNYAEFSETFLRVDERRIIIENPGGFPPGVDPEDPVPRPRNPFIYERMFEMGYVEKRGRGIEYMKKLCDAANCRLTIKTRDGWTQVVFEASGIEEDLLRILELLDRPRKATEIAKALGISKVTALKRLKKLMDLGLVKKVGRGPVTYYEKR